jgi:V8-like Glu-specific endopeptidase
MARGWKLLPTLLMGVASVASGSVFGADDRLLVSHARGSPFAPIGVAYDPANNRYGTGMLVDECHVLTAEHVASVDGTDPRGTRFDFLVGQKADLGFERKSGATVIASGGFNQADWNRDADWLLLKLDQCLGREFGHVTLSAAPPPARDPLHSAGYPSDRIGLKGQLIVDPRCRIVGEAVRLWLHTCAGRAGDSGGPLFRIGETTSGPMIEVYAIQAAAFPAYVRREPNVRDFDPRRPFTGLNEAVPVANILPVIAPYLAAS